MSRQNRTQETNRNSAEQKRDIADNNNRYTENNRENKRSEEKRNEISRSIQLDRYGLNDLYERSSI
jgi:hypothetical protein